MISQPGGESSHNEKKFVTYPKDGFGVLHPPVPRLRYGWLGGARACSDLDGSALGAGDGEALVTPQGGDDDPAFSVQPSV